MINLRDLLHDFGLEMLDEGLNSLTGFYDEEREKVVNEKLDELIDNIKERIIG